MNDLYEAHITFDGCHKRIVEENCPNGWKFSAITGDPVLGNKDFCYLTSHDSDGKRLLARMSIVTLEYWLKQVYAVRLKVEKIVYDTKTNRDELNLTNCLYPNLVEQADTPTSKFGG